MHHVFKCNHGTFVYDDHYVWFQEKEGSAATFRSGARATCPHILPVQWWWLSNRTALFEHSGGKIDVRTEHEKKLANNMLCHVELTD